MSENCAYSCQKSFLIILVSTFIASCGGGSSSPAPSTNAPLPPAPNQEPEQPVAPVAEGQFGTVVVERSVSDLVPLVDALGCDGAVSNVETAFIDVSQSAGLCYSTSISVHDSPSARVTGGIAVSDYNADGRLDIYVSHGRNTPSKLFSLRKDSGFIETTTAAGVALTVAGHGGTFMDINLDGLPDLMSLGESPRFLTVFVNNGDGTFDDITNSTGLNFTRGAFSAAAGDYDLDGDLDLFFGHWQIGLPQSRSEFFWQNQGNGSFVDITPLVQIGRNTFLPLGETAMDNPQDFSFTPIFTDINDDRYPDLLVASDLTTSQVLINASGTGLVDMTNSDVITDKTGMGGTVADYDNDGDLDWFVTAVRDRRSLALNGNRLYQNDGTGGFLDVTNEAGVREGHWGWGTCFADFNNDGYQDIFLVNGYEGLTEGAKDSGGFEPFYEDPALLYINNGNGTFTERSTELGVIHTAQGRGLACYDYDRDGDLDMIIANSGLPPTLFRNESFAEGNNFLNITLRGRKVNPQAVGARIFVTAGDQEFVSELQLGNNYLSQNPVEAHFGLGTAEMVDQVKILWPGNDGEISEFTNVGVNQFLIVHQPEL